MTKLRSLTLVNYRRFAGEVRLPLDPGVNMVVIPPGMGKTTVLEAVSWCVLGTELVSDPEQVPNAEALDADLAEVGVALDFINGELLERSASYSRVGGRVEMLGCGWRLTDADGDVIASGNAKKGLAFEAERRFPPSCVHANLISGSSLARVPEGAASGPERAVRCSDAQCTADLNIRCSMRATELFLSLCPGAPVRAIGYGPYSQPEVTVEGMLTPEQVRLAVLCHAIAFVQESAGDCPLFLDDPLDGTGDGDRRSMFSRILETIPSMQVIFLLSDPQDIEALRSSGRVDKELEIRG